MTMQANETVTDRLVAFIKSHDVECWTEEGVIFAIDVYTLNGQTFEQKVHVPATLQAAREFLNY